MESLDDGDDPHLQPGPGLDAPRLRIPGSLDAGFWDHWTREFRDHWTMEIACSSSQDQGCRRSPVRGSGTAG